MIVKGVGIKIHFQGVKAVDGVDIDVRPSEILGLIGPNGAGKTTLVNALTGFVPLTEGELWFGDTRVTNSTPNQMAKMGIARTFQSVRLFRGMSVRDNVEVGGLGIGLSPRIARRQADELLERFGLANRAGLSAASLSFGEEQRLSIARALATCPKFLFLDEPAAGLNEAESDELARNIGEIRRVQNCGILLVEHDMRLVLNLCDRIHVLDEGATISTGSPAEIQTDKAVVSAYLGTRKFQVGTSGQPGTSDIAKAELPATVAAISNNLPAGATVGAQSGRDVVEADEILSVQDLHVHYGPIRALRGVSLSLKRNQMVGVVGPNGAGKSTMMLAISGLQKVMLGEIRFDGRPVRGWKPEDLARLGISLVPERRQIFAQLTVEENLRLAGTAAQGSRDVADLLDDLYQRLPVLRDRRHSQAGDLSGGQQQQLAIARALMTKPRLLLVDEPSLGLAPLMVERVFDTLAELPKRGVSVLLVEQNALAAIEMCDHIYMLRSGQITLDVAGGDNSQREQLARLYMDQLGLQSDSASTAAGVV